MAELSIKDQKSVQSTIFVFGQPLWEQILDLHTYTCQDSYWKIPIIVSNPKFGSAFYEGPRKRTENDFCVWATLMRANSWLTCPYMSRFVLRYTYYSLQSKIWLSFLWRTKKVYRALSLFVGNPFESKFLTYTPIYVKIHTEKYLS